MRATSSFFCLSLLLVVWEAHYDRSVRSGRKGHRHTETATAVALGSGGATSMALRAARSGIEIQDHTHTPYIIPLSLLKPFSMTLEYENRFSSSSSSKTTSRRMAYPMPPERRRHLSQMSPTPENNSTTGGLGCTGAVFEGDEEIFIRCLVRRCSSIKDRAGGFVLRS